MINENQGFWSRLVFGRDIAIPEMPEVFSEMSPELLPPTRSNTVMNPDVALTISSVFRAVQILSTVCSDLPLKATRNGEAIDAPSLIKKPDYDRSYTSFIKRAVIDLALHGNAYFLKSRDARGQVINLRVLDPNSVSIGYDNSGNKIYEVAYNGDSRTYKDNEIQHLRLLEIPGMTLGLGPIQADKAELTNAKNVQQYATIWFQTSNGIPQGTLNTTESLDGVDVSAYIAGWYEMLSDGNKTAILSNGLKYTPLSLSPSDLQWLEVRQFDKSQVATIFGIPPTYLGAEENHTSFVYSNAQQVNQTFYQQTLRAYLSEIEEALSECLPNRVEAHFDLTKLLRADDKTRYEAYAVGITAGILTVNEVRESEGLEPLPEPKPLPVEPVAAPIEEPPTGEPDA